MSKDNEMNIDFLDLWTLALLKFWIFGVVLNFLGADDVD